MVDISSVLGYNIFEINENRKEDREHEHYHI